MEIEPKESVNWAPKSTISDSNKKIVKVVKIIYIQFNFPHLLLFARLCESIFLNTTNKQNKPFQVTSSVMATEMQRE